MSATARIDRRRLREALEPVVAATGCDVEDVSDQKAGSRRLLRVVVDKDGGVTDEDITAVTHAVSAALDAVDVFGDAPYVLEVSTPGVDRPLTEPRHWRRAAGRLVKAALSDGGEVLGRVSETDDEGAVLLVGDERRPVRVEYAAVVKARMQVEFNRPGSAGADDADGDGFDDEADGLEDEDGFDDADEDGFDDGSEDGDAEPGDDGPDDDATGEGAQRAGADED